jgi:ATPase subunit of ABC transporter with duplicated ATPase domains
MTTTEIYQRQQEIIDRRKVIIRKNRSTRGKQRETWAKVRADRSRKTQNDQNKLGWQEVITKKALVMIKTCPSVIRGKLFFQETMASWMGETSGICGDNASGESTLLKTIAGLFLL